jgi:hypothetical protein
MKKKSKNRIKIKKRQTMQSGVQRYGKLIFAGGLSTEGGRGGLAAALMPIVYSDN